MKRTNIYLDEALDRLLRHYAVEQNRSFTDVVRQALEDFVAKEGIQSTLPASLALPSSGWRDEMEALLAEVRSGISSDVSPEELEADIDAAWEEYRREQPSQLTMHD